MGTAIYDFTGEVAFVTGASGGMGRAIAAAFTHAGASVVLADVDQAGGAESEGLANEAGTSSGGTAVFVRFS